MLLKILFIGLMIVCILGVIYCTIMLAKTEVTYRHLNMLLEATHAYNLDCIDRDALDEMLNYFDIFPTYDSVLYRYFDWGYENILPKEVMEKIRPFIKETK